MSKPVVPDVVLAERQRILAILYRANVQLPGPAAVAINRGQDAKAFCPEREAKSDETAAVSGKPPVATVAGRRPWTEITASLNAQRRAATATPSDTPDDAAAEQSA